MPHALKLINLKVAIDNIEIIQRLSLLLAEGEIACLLGPSGCGKTTLLRAISGFLQPASGEIWVHGVRASDAKSLIPVEHRNIGMVFQDAVLFPHLNTRENIEFGLFKDNAQQKAARTAELAQLLSLEGCLNKYPHSLSYGQQQRVALARAMAPAPKILLLDEPFSSLDIELRQYLAREIRLVLKQTGITAIMVSHNQLEAFAIADQIGVMKRGQLLQWGSAFNLYHEPISPEVANFIGQGTFVSGCSISQYQIETTSGKTRNLNLNGQSLSEDMMVLIRPDDIIHDDSSMQTAMVEEKIFQGAEFLYTLQLNSGEKVLSLVPSHHNHAIGEHIGIRIELDHLVVFPKDI